MPLDEKPINIFQYIQNLEMEIEAWKENSKQWQAIAELLDYDNQPIYHEWCERNPE